MNDYFAFDFDGVVCDSARETGETAWRAAHAMWPERIAPRPSADYLSRFSRLRPVIETGYENVPLVMLVVQGLEDEEILADFHALCEDFIRTASLERSVLRDRFAEARDAWRDADMDSWLAAQGFFPGVVDAINALDAPRCIITTKQERFTRLLVEHAGLDVSPDRIYALESFEGKGKGSVLQTLAGEMSGTRFHFFEDRFRTLDGLQVPADIRMYLVDWGYNTAAEREQAAADPRIELLDRASFEATLARGGER